MHFFFYIFLHHIFLVACRIPPHCCSTKGVECPPNLFPVLRRAPFHRALLRPMTGMLQQSMRAFFGGSTVHQWGRPWPPKPAGKARRGLAHGHGAASLAIAQSGPTLLSALPPCTGDPVSQPGGDPPDPGVTLLTQEGSGGFREKAGGFGTPDPFKQEVTHPETIRFHPLCSVVESNAAENQPWFQRSHGEGRPHSRMTRRRTCECFSSRRGPHRVIPASPSSGGHCWLRACRCRALLASGNKPLAGGGRLPAPRGPAGPELARGVRLAHVRMRLPLWIGRHVPQSVHKRREVFSFWLRTIP